MERFVQAHPNLYDSPILVYDDDPAVSIAVKRVELPDGRLSLSIATNGKVDGNSAGDYTTMAMLALLPAMLAERPERAFVVGWGTGVTAGELASYEEIKDVTVAEISRAVVRAAPRFDGVTRGASANPKIRIVQSDAYRALLRSEGDFDLIVSEPSNPWVAGVEMLYAFEFLEAARERLRPGGVFCQWFHLYETDAATLQLILRTYASVFDQVAVWRSRGADVLLLGFEEADADTLYYRLAGRSERPDFRASLERAGFQALDELLAREVLPLGVVDAVLFRGPLHTLYHPRLSHVAGLAFHRGGTAELPFLGYGEPARVGARSSLLQQHIRSRGGRLTNEEWQRITLEICDDPAAGRPCLSFLARAVHERNEGPPDIPPEASGDARARLERIAQLARLYRSVAELQREAEWTTPARAVEDTESFVEYFHHGVPFAADSLLHTWSNCREVISSEAECRQQVESRLGIASAGKSVEQLVQECRSARSRGSTCQAGLDQARELLETGSTGE
jgi:spermidine synthase